MTLLPGLEGEARSAALSQWYTPPSLADRAVAWGLQRDPHAQTFLEPSVGRGALLLALYAQCAKEPLVTAFDVDAANILHVGERWPSSSLRVICMDFLDADLGARVFDLSVFNPPFEDGNDAAFAEKVCAHSDVSIGIFRNVFLHGAERYSRFWRHHDVRRMAVLPRRPDFGGEIGAKTDFVVLDLVRRAHVRMQGEPTPATVEWWNL